MTDENSAMRSRKRRGARWHLTMPVVAILLVGALLSAALALWIHSTLAMAEASQFERLASRLEREVRDRFERTTFGLKGAQASFVSNQHVGLGVGRSQFRSWVTARQIEKDFPGVRGFGLIQPVDRGNLQRFIASERADEAPQFDVRQLVDSGEETLYVIKFIEPIDRNAAAVGLDVGSEPRRRRAIERAIDTADITITEPILLVQDGKKTPGFLIYAPYYRTTTALSVPELRRSSIGGILYAPVVAQELLADITGVSDHKVDLELFAGPVESGGQPGELVFDSDASKSGADPQSVERSHRLVRSITILGSPFTLELKASSGFESAGNEWQAWMVLLSGLVMTGMLARLVQQKSAQQAQAEDYAQGVTADLERLALVARRTSDAVIITDAQRQILWVNEAFAQITGYTLAEVKGQVPGRMLQFEATDAAEVARLRAALDAGEGFRGELLNRGKSGKVYWISLEIQPLRAADGALTGFMAVEVDITERKATLLRLREAEAEAQRLAMVARRTSNAVVITDRQLRIEWVNEAFTRLYGYSAEEAIGRTPGDLLGGTHTPASAVATLRDAAAAGTGCRVEVINRTADGRELWIDTEVQPRLNAAGRVDGFVEIQSDITARRQAEAEAKRSSDLLHHAIEAIDEAFVLYDVNDRLVMCNQRYRQVYAHSADLIVPGARFEDIIRGGAERGQYAEAVGRVDEWVAERMATHRAGTTARTQRLQDGRTLRIVERRLADGHIVGFRVDVTELERSREQAEASRQEAAEALARLQAIYNMLPVGIAITDPQGHIIDCNPASERLLGVSKAEHLARRYDAREWAILREDGSPMPPEEFASVRALSEQRAVHDAVMQVVTPQRTVWLSVSAMPADHPDLGVVIGYVDISEQRAQQAALQQAKLSAEQASLAKTQFLANMSHEIRTPMNAILGMLQLLRKTGLDPRQRDYAAKTEGAARSLLGLLNDVLDFSKVEAGKMTLDPQPFSLETLMADLSVIFAASVGEKPVEVLFDLDAEVPDALVGDAMRLQQVLINLGGNAIKFTSRGEVVLSVRLLELARRNARLAFAVRDTGIGIAEDNLARIFSGFTQAEASTTRRFGGTGLGVAISQRIVTLMGGDLKVRSELGRGSEFGFEIDLPVAPGQQTRYADPLAATARRVLVVDDHPLAREFMLHSAQSLGWEVDAAGDALGALDAFDAAARSGKPYDAVFVDWVMPGVDGWGLVKTLRSREVKDGNRRLRIVMVTAHGREGLHSRTAEEQALIDGFLVKPVTTGMLADALRPARASADSMEPPQEGGPGPLAGIHLLVAEDNPNNQQVARELLEDEGATVELVSHGGEAVQAIAASPQRFDLVLMDLQMPVMDGLEATRNIRSRLGRHDLPIVAMTANAMASDRAACLAAGMTDHVGKPFDVAQLVRVILRHLGREIVDGAVTSPGVPETAADAHPDPVVAAAREAGIEMTEALARLGGRRPVYMRLAKGFLDDLAELPSTLAAHVTAADHEDLLRTLHTAKGVAGTLGMSRLAATLRATESAVRELATGGMSVIPEGLLTNANSEIENALTALQALIRLGNEVDSSRPSSDVPRDLDAVRSSLERLVRLLADSDLSALEEVGRLERLHPGGEPAWLVDLRQRVETMAFETAIQIGHAQLKSLADTTIRAD